MKSILVTSYVNPDLDGVAGMVAYAEFLQKTGKNAIAGMFDDPQEEAKYVLKRFCFEYPQALTNTDNFDKIILVDASELSVLQEKISPDRVIEIIDHRLTHEVDKFPNAKVQIELVGAAATLIAEKFMENRIEISVKSATLLYSAIISNTVNFKAGVCTNRDKVAASWLNQFAKLSENFWKELFIAKSDFTGSSLFERIDSDLAIKELGNKKIGIAQLEIIGVQNLIDDRGGEIIQVLEQIKAAENLDLVFINAIELEAGKNYFVATDAQTKKLLEKVLNIKFSGAVAERPGVLMRKEILPLIKKELED
ncbi:MAG: hypothetical protein ACD_76C00156G0005 [uncultured bacterium]|nr:MAG: hypothetical protein ACD_76C00156G0005 [uncultured bacterium]HBD05171.1 hypothetical protein [Candidatus Uhrbacteria bacterium]